MLPRNVKISSEQRKNKNETQSTGECLMKGRGGRTQEQRTIRRKRTREWSEVEQSEKRWSAVEMERMENERELNLLEYERAVLLLVSNFISFVDFCVVREMALGFERSGLVRCVLHQHIRFIILKVSESE